MYVEEGKNRLKKKERKAFPCDSLAQRFQPIDKRNSILFIQYCKVLI